MFVRDFAGFRSRGASTLPPTDGAIRSNGGRDKMLPTQARRRGHVRKRSEGSSYRGSDDAGRRPGVAREENSKRLIEAFGKVST